MTEPSTATTGHPKPTASDDSFGRMLLVFALVGIPLVGVGLRFAEAAPTRFGVSAMEAGFLLGTVAFCLLWLGGFRPSLRAAVAFFFVEGFVSLVLVLSAAAVVTVGIGSWLTVVLRLVSVVVTAWVVFGGAGSRAAAWAYRRLRHQLQLPNDEPRERR